MTRYMLRRLARAAAMRARAAPWVTVAAAVKSRPEVCRGWSDKYPAVWQALAAEAERMVWEEIEAEARWVLAQMAASGEENAARLLRQYGGQSR